MDKYLIRKNLTRFHGYKEFIQLLINLFIMRLIILFFSSFFSFFPHLFPLFKKKHYYLFIFSTASDITNDLSSAKIPPFKINKHSSTKFVTKTSLYLHLQRDSQCLMRLYCQIVLHWFIQHFYLTF